MKKKFSPCEVGLPDFRMYHEFSDTMYNVKNLINNPFYANYIL